LHSAAILLGKDKKKQMSKWVPKKFNFQFSNGVELALLKKPNKKSLLKSTRT